MNTETAEAIDRIRVALNNGNMADINPADARALLAEFDVRTERLNRLIDHAIEIGVALTEARAALQA